MSEMTTRRMSDELYQSIRARADAGETVVDLCREFGVAQASYYGKKSRSEKPAVVAHTLIVPDSKCGEIAEIKLLAKMLPRQDKRPIWMFQMGRLCDRLEL